MKHPILTILLLLTPSLALARTVALDVVQTPDIPCPNAAQIQPRIAARTQLARFNRRSTERIEIRWARLPAGGFSAQITMIDHGKNLAQRNLESRETTCGALADATALLIAIALDPDAKTGKVKSAPPPPTVTKPINQPKRVREVIVPIEDNPPSHPPWVLGVDAGLLTATGMAPSISLGGLLAFEAQRGPLNFGVELRILSTTTTFNNTAGQAKSSIYGIGPRACYSIAPLDLCLLGVIGLQRHQGQGFDDNRVIENVLITPGARIGLRWQFNRLYLRAAIDGLSNLAGVALRIDNRIVWQTPWLSVHGVFAVGLRFQ